MCRFSLTCSIVVFVSLPFLSKKDLSLQASTAMENRSQGMYTCVTSLEIKVQRTNSQTAHAHSDTKR